MRLEGVPQRMACVAVQTGEERDRHEDLLSWARGVQ